MTHRHRAHARYAGNHRRTTDPDTARRAREIIALTDHPCYDPATCSLEQISDFYIKDLTALLPGIDPAVIGRVAMAASGSASAAMRMYGVNLDDPANACVATALTVLGAAGGRMYLKATEGA